MKIVFDIFSNREVALMVWITILLLFLFTKRDTRKSFGGLVKAFFAKKLITLFSLMAVYVFAIVFILYKLTFWENDLLKDTLFWFFSIAAVMFFNANKADTTNFFSKNICEAIRWTIILEFIINFYSFSFPIELVLVPILILIGATQAFAEVSPKKVANQEQVVKLLQNILIFFGIVTIIFVIYKTILEYNILFTVLNLKSLLLPAILTILFLPFIYYLAVGIKYEMLFLHLKFMVSDKSLRNKIKWKIFLAATFNLTKLQSVSKKVNKAGFYDNENDNLDSYISSILK